MVLCWCWPEPQTTPWVAVISTEPFFTEEEGRRVDSCILLLNRQHIVLRSSFFFQSTFHVAKRKCHVPTDNDDCSVLPFQFNPILVHPYIFDDYP